MTTATTASDVQELTYRDALREAHRDALRRDERVFLMGEDVGAYGGCFGVSLGLLEEFGPERIRDTPLSESAFVGAGIGAALNGMRPIVEIMTVNFSLLALDQIMNNAASLLHMSGGQFNVPLVIRMTTGGGRQLAAQHSHSLEGWYAHIPGIRILTPATLEDARGMLPTALEDPDPVLIFEHGSLYNVQGELPVDAGAVDIDHAAVRRTGTDVTLVTYGGSLGKTLDAAEQLAARRRLAPRSSTCARCDRSTTRPTSARCAGPTTSSSSTRDGAPAASRPRWSPGSSSRRCTTWTARWPGSAPPRCRCPTPSTSRTPPSPRSSGSWPRRGRPWGWTMADFRMPSLGADMDEGTVLEWLVHPGDEVHKGDIVAVVDTAKAAVEVETFVEGVVTELLVDVGSKVPVGTPLARIDARGTPAQPAPAPARPPVEPTEAVEPVPATAPGGAPRAPGHAPRPHARQRARRRPRDRDGHRRSGQDHPQGRPTCGGRGRRRHRRPVPPAEPVRRRPAPSRRPATPYARRLAEELGVDLGALDVDGVVDADDVREAAVRLAAPPAPEVAAAEAPAPAHRPAARTSSRATPPSRSRPPGPDARDHRPAHGPLEARDPALLPVDDRRPGAAPVAGCRSATATSR